jgi:hypothetical protein
MTHAEASQSFDAYFAGSLDRESTRALHQHLKTCESCQSRVRVQHAMGKSSLKETSKELTSPETQAAIARNRDLLIKILLLLVFGWAIYRLRP